MNSSAGFVALLGAPNAGKSTLLNRLLGEKLSIVTPKAQTTRMRTLGILTQGDVQMGILDTPGIFRPKTRFEKAMVRAAWESLDQADSIVVILDAAAKDAHEKASNILEVLAHRKLKATLVLNKSDRIKVEKLLPLSAKLHESGLFDDVFMISALSGDGMDALKTHLLACMPKGPWLFPADQLTDLPERLCAAEITREQLLLQLHEELPYGAAVLPESWAAGKDGALHIHQQIVVAKDSHRAMVLGKKGAKIRSIGQAARQEMETQFDCRVHLFLNVKADQRWQERASFYDLFGLESKK
ncbi:MAG: GTPase Era [Alphaproteobacteria bacterium]|nr:GTPase Era [Alphaproteobacteria bacterium]